MRDLLSGVTTCLSCRNPGGAFDPHLSGEGRVVVFTLQQASRGPGIRRTDIAIFDRTTLITSVITREANGSSGRPSVSANGRFIVFQSQASNLECKRRCGPDVTDENLLSDVYLFDRETGTFTRLSGDPRSWWAPSVEPSVDARGHVVVFSSRQPLSVEDTTTAFDLFIWTRERSPLSLLSGRLVGLVGLAIVSPGQRFGPPRDASRRRTCPLGRLLTER